MAPPAEEVRSIVSDDVDAAVTALYAGPPDEFVTGRDALVRRLRAAKRRDEANAVKALRKPKAVAGALNAARLSAPGAVADLVRAADAVGEVQDGGGDVRAALDRLRAAERAVTEAATVTDRGVDVAAVRGAVRAVLADPGALAALGAGRLVDVPAGGGLGGFGGAGGLGTTDTGGPAAAAAPTDHAASAPRGEDGGRRSTRSRARAAPEATGAAGRGDRRAGGARRRTERVADARQGDSRAVAAARRAVAEAEEALRLAAAAADEIAPSVAEAEAAERSARDEAEAAVRAADHARERALDLARRATAARREAAALARRRDQAAAKVDTARARLAKAEDG